MEFETEVAERIKVNLDDYKSVRQISGVRLAKMLAVWGSGLLLILGILLCMPWTQNIYMTGSLTTFSPADRPQTIHSTIAGRIERWHVREGQYVKKGDTIISLSEIKEKYFDPQMLKRLSEQVKAKEEVIGSTREKISALERQVSALIAGKGQKLNQVRNKAAQARLKVQSDSIDYETERVNFAIAQRQFGAQEKLYAEGLKSLTELEERKQKLQQSNSKLLSSLNKYNTSKNELVNTLIDYNGTESEYRDKIAKAESEKSTAAGYLYTSEGELAKMRNEYASTSVRSNYYEILAPRDGYVTKAIKMGLGETLKEGEAVTSIINVGVGMAAELYVKPMDLPLLSKGSKVRLQFDGWPALVFSGWPNLNYGTFGGKVAVIDNVDTKGYYRLLIVPDLNEGSWPAQVRLGTGIKGWALLKDVPIFYEIWRQLNGFPPDYMHVDPEAPADLKRKDDASPEKGSNESESK
ncbi:MAG: biotin/lipoyl-binding protein [Bacteroidota bacterium]